MRPTYLFLTASFPFTIGTANAEVLQERRLSFDMDIRAGWVHGDHSGGGALGASPRLRYRVLALGAEFQGATILLGSMGSVGVTGGLSLPLERVRIDALAEVGFNAYDRVGSNFMLDDPGASGTLPYSGGRAAVLFRVLGNATGRSMWVGLTASYARDLHTGDHTYTYVESGDGWFGETNDQEFTRTVRMGQERLSAFVTTSFTIPL